MVFNSRKVNEQGAPSGIPDAPPIESRYLRLRSRYGSPLYVYELSAVRAACEALRRALPSPSVLYYSLKANPHPRLVAELGRMGCWAEVSSSAELDTALAAVPAGRCLYTGPGKSRPEVDLALERGVARFSVESPRDLRTVSERAAALRRPVEVVLRINPDRAARGAGLAMSGTSQFGADVGRVASRPDDFRTTGPASIAGFHVYTGSNVPSVDLLLEAMAAALDAIGRAADALGVRPRLVDLGGGFGHPFGRHGDRPDYSALRAHLEACLDARLPGWRRGEPVIAFESGRYLVGGAGTLVSTVEDVKTSGGTRYVVLDSGINHLGGLSGLGRLLRAEPDVTPVPGAAGRRGPDHASDARVVGPLCTPLDTVAAHAHLPAVRPGTAVTVPNVGAYGLTASLIGFLSRPCPVEVVLDGGNVVEASRMVLGRAAVE